MCNEPVWHIAYAIGPPRTEGVAARRTVARMEKRIAEVVVLFEFAMVGVGGKEAVCTLH